LADPDLGKDLIPHAVRVAVEFSEADQDEQPAHAEAQQPAGDISPFPRRSNDHRSSAAEQRHVDPSPNCTTVLFPLRLMSGAAITE
jgi:hypothetical protein